MSASAQPRSQLLSQLRTSYNQQPQAGLNSLRRQPPMASAPVSDPQAIQSVPPSQPASVTPPPAPMIPVAPVAPSVAQNFFSTNEQLDVLEQSLDEVMASKVAAEPMAEAPAVPSEAPAPVAPPASTAPSEPTFAAAIPQAIDQTWQAAQVNTASSSPTKEVIQPAAATEVPETLEPPVEAAPAVATEAAPAANPMESGQANYQEVDHSGPEMEISPEIAAYLEEIKSHQDQLPQEIVVAGNDVQLQPQAQPLRPVIVLPITPEIEAVGAKAKPKNSVRWLVEWSRRLMKMFAGRVVYKESEGT